MRGKAWFNAKDLGSLRLDMRQGFADQPRGAFRDVASPAGDGMSWIEGGLETSPTPAAAVRRHEDECGQDFACIRRITPGEVFDVVTPFL